jgi:hypothetical protein
MIDDISEPGAWANEMKAAPWAYGQSQSNQVRQSLQEIRAKGLWIEADVLEREIRTLTQEVTSLRGIK